MYRNKPYSFHVKFPEAEGIDKGVPLRCSLGVVLRSRTGCCARDHGRAGLFEFDR